MELLILILMIVILIYKRRSRINLIRLLKNLSYFICYLFMYVRPIIHGVDQLFIMQGKLFQRCTHLLYCSVLSLGANVNARWMAKPDTGSIFHIKNQWTILVKGNYYVNYQNSMLLTSSDTTRTLMHLFLFTNSARRELVSICTQSIRSCN